MSKSKPKPTWRVGGSDSKKHAQIYKPMTESEAWKSLSGSAVKLYVELVMQHPGDKVNPSGKVIVTNRQAVQRTGLGKNAVSRAFNELVEKGFLKIRDEDKGGFPRKMSVYHFSDKWATWTKPDPEVKPKSEVKPEPDPELIPPW